MTTDENAPTEGTKAADAADPRGAAAASQPSQSTNAPVGAHSVDRLAHGYQPLTRREARELEEVRRTGAIPVQSPPVVAPGAPVVPPVLSPPAVPGSQEEPGPQAADPAVLPQPPAVVPPARDPSLSVPPPPPVGGGPEGDVPPPVTPPPSPPPAPLSAEPGSVVGVEPVPTAQAWSAVPAESAVPVRPTEPSEPGAAPAVSLDSLIAPPGTVAPTSGEPPAPDSFSQLLDTAAEQLRAEQAASASSVQGWEHLESHAEESNGWESGSVAIIKEDHPPHRRRRWLGLVIAVVVVALVAGGGIFAWQVFAPKIGFIAQAVGSDDFTGEGSGSVEVTIKEGATGADVANSLAAAGVVKTSNSFYQLILGMSPAPTFYPGVYRLHKGMSAQDALKLLQNPSSSVGKSLAVPEGETQKEIIAAAVKDGISASDMQNAINAAVANPAAFGLPAGLAPFFAKTKNLEGFLFPATYVVTPGMTAKQLVTQMTQRAMQAYAADGLPTDAQTLWNDVTLASIVQKEAGPNPGDAAKVARVFDNRLAQGMALQSDATVAYGAGVTGKVFTTPAERADASDPYNTYAHTGLPVGPISNPGDTALKAAVNPTAGDWLYFVVVNLQTGETVFSETYAEHQAADAQLDAWCAASPANEKLCQ